MLIRYGIETENKPNPANTPLLTMGTGSLGLLKDLQHLWLMTAEVKLGWVILQQCSRHFGMRNSNFLVYN